MQNVTQLAETATRQVGAAVARLGTSAEYLASVIAHETARGTITADELRQALKPARKPQPTGESTHMKSTNAMGLVGLAGAILAGMSGPSLALPAVSRNVSRSPFDGGNRPHKNHKPRNPHKVKRARLFKGHRP